MQSQIDVGSNFIDIDGIKVHYKQKGQGQPIVFLHGIPTSSFLWRKVMDDLSPLGTCIAIDLPGYGLSQKPTEDFTIHDHIHFFEKFMQKLHLKNVTLVMHGWGSIIGLSYAMRHLKTIKGIALYEAFLRPFAGDTISLPFQEQILDLEKMAATTDLHSNGISFVDTIIRQSLLDTISSNDMASYEFPFKDTGSVKPILQYIKELPKGDGTSEVDKLIANYAMQLCHTEIPKLLLYTLPGFITTMATIMWAKANFNHLEIIDLGEGLHFAQERHPTRMANAISAWLQGIEQTEKASF